MSGMEQLPGGERPEPTTASLRWSYDKAIMEGHKIHSDALFSFLKLLSPEGREVFLQEKIAFTATIRNHTWRSSLELLKVNKDILLHPNEFTPLMGYPSSAFSIGYEDSAVNDYYVQPRIVTDKCDEAYNEFRNWLVEQDGEFTDTSFLRGIRGLGVNLLFFRRTDQKYALDVPYEDFVGRDENGFIVVRDKRLETLISFPDQIIGTESLRGLEAESPEYFERFRSILLYFTAQDRIAQEQYILLDQLTVQHVNFNQMVEFDITNSSPDFRFPSL